MKKKLTVFGFVKIIKKSLGGNLLLAGGFEGVLNFIAMSLRLRAESAEVHGTYAWYKYHEAANKIHDALDKRGYYDE